MWAVCQIDFRRIASALVSETALHLTLTSSLEPAKGQAKHGSTVRSPLAEGVASGAS